MKQSHTQREVGPWARQKLSVLREYLQFYTTALKRQNFDLVYIDAFAGSRKFRVRDAKATGQHAFDFFLTDPDSIMPHDFNQYCLFEEDSKSDISEVRNKDTEESNKYIHGSPYCALNLPKFCGFNRHYFFEKDPKRVDDLKKLEEEFPNKNICVKKGDANILIRDLVQGRKLFQHEHARGVAFLDPYGPHLEWATVEALAKTKKMEVIINFPVNMATNRLIPKSGEMEESWMERLNLHFGTKDWHGVVYERSQGLFGEMLQKQDGVPDKLLELYISCLKVVYACVATPHRVENTRRSPLYYLIWAGPNSLGIKGAERILSKRSMELQWWADNS